MPNDTMNRNNEPQEIEPQEPPVAQDANEVIERPNEQWWENRGGGSGEVH